MVVKLGHKARKGKKGTVGNKVHGQGFVMFGSKAVKAGDCVSGRGVNVGIDMTGNSDKGEAGRGASLAKLIEVAAGGCGLHSNPFKQAC